MGLGGFILGGALGGVGKGMQMQAEQNALERREARLAAARQAERQEDREWKLQDDSAAEDRTARRDRRLHNYDQENEATKFGNQSALADKADKAEAAKEKREEARTIRLETFRSQLGMVETEFEKKLAKQLESGEINDILESEDGTYIAVDKNGRTRSLGFKAKPKPESATGEGGSSLLTNTGKPAARAGSTASVNSGKILTRAQLAEAAKAQGKSEAQMEAEAKRLGFTIR